MKSIRVAVFAFIVSAGLGLGPSVQARQEFDTEFRPYRGSPVIRVWQDYLLKAGDDARDVVVISGDAAIEGHIRGDLIVIFGAARLGSAAVIDGQLTVVAGSVTIADGASVRRDLVVVGGTLDAPPGFMPGGQHVVVGATSLGDRLRTIVPWFTRGLLWGRLIVPDLGWVWGGVFVFLILSLALNLLLQEPIASCARTLSARPFSTFLTGLLVLLLTGPISLLLAATVIGIAVVPFLFCAVLVAWMAGKVGVVRWIGRSITGQQGPETQLQSMRSVAIGFTALVLLYMVPILGIVTWALVGVFGLGAASLAFLGALRRERPAVPKPAKAVPPAPAAIDAPATAFTSSPAEPFVPPIQPVQPAPPYPAPDQPSAAVLGMDLTLLPRATFLDRAAAFALDIALMLIVMGLLDFRNRDNAGPIILFAYFIGFWAWKGTTIGGIVCNLRVTRTDGAPMRFIDALVRGLSSLFSFAALGLGCLWILRDPERQAWHDKIAGTYVVKVPRDWPLP
jgi:uncharacterized RDD family membrane protein YckC